jgi:aminomethyltransferase
MAIARLDPAYAVQGRKLEVRTKAGTMKAISHTLPFDDPEKLKRIAKG